MSRPHRCTALAALLFTSLVGSSWVDAPLLGAGIAHADSLGGIFERANAAYFQGDYDAAAEGYRRLLELGVVDADVTYDLAVAEARRARYGEAIRFFERTLWLRPGDADAREGLEIARAAVGRQRAQRHGEAELDTGPPIAEALFGGVPRNVLAVSTLVFDLAFFGVLVALLFVRRETARLGLGIAAPLLAVALLVSGFGLAIVSGWFDEGEPAVVVARRASLREGPDLRATERHRALEGQRAWVLDADREWLRVRVPMVGEGWVRSSEVGRVRPPPTSGGR